MKTEALMEELECAKANLRLVIKKAPRRRRAEVEEALQDAAEAINRTIAILEAR